MHAPYVELQSRLRRVAALASVGELLGWDQETMMPPKAASFRAEELGAISALAHEQAIDPRIGELLAACEADASLAADPRTAANLREIRRDYDRSRKLPTDLVVELSETASRAMEAWKQARSESDFERFRPWLDRQIDLARRKAACYGIPDGGEAYDALVEDYEPRTPVARIEQLFAPLREGLCTLIAAVSASGRDPDAGLQRIALPRERQEAFCRSVLERLGFDLEAGRLDVSAHPFSAGIAPGDTRITTRYREDGFLDALGSTMHEAGHALYEQGLPKDEWHGQPLAEALSLGIHESQSRMWENQVGRSRAFWSWAWPIAKRVFGAALDGHSADAAFRTVNAVRPNLIRVESDEATYNLHVMLRFDLERAMIRGDLRSRELPAAWNERMKQDLGLDVPDDRRGCLQDVHWSSGAFGYFPTYSLGNLYAAQLWEAAEAAIPDLEAQLARGEFGGLLLWLRQSVHEHGRRFFASELCRRVTGREVGHEPLLGYLAGKLGPIYGFDGRSAVSAR
jgi:carboxypeptidase Taq